jgi:hypothetical protein
LFFDGKINRRNVFLLCVSLQKDCRFDLLSDSEQKHWYATDAETKQVMEKSENEYRKNGAALKTDLKLSDDFCKSCGLKRVKVKGDGVFSFLIPFILYF